MCLVDDVDAPLAAHDTAVLVALFQRLKRIDNLHARIPRQGPEDRERAGRSQIRRADRQVCAACDLPISRKAASATDRHECPLLMQAQRGPIYQHPPMWTVPRPLRLTLLLRRAARIPKIRCRTTVASARP